MKKILLGLAGLLVSVICNAQITPAKRIDTLVISTLKYNEVELEKEDWPFDTIYKSKSDFTIGDRTFNIAEVNKWGRNSHYVIVDPKKKNDMPLELWMTTGNLRKFTIILFNGYEFHCISSGYIPVEKYNSQPCVVSHTVEGRDVVRMEFPEFLCHDEGEVTVLVQLDPSGHVTDTRIIDNISDNSKCLRYFARRSASMSIFSKSESAGTQIGEIVYRFNQDKTSRDKKKLFGNSGQ